MDILACILKIYPDWKGAVRGNTYDGIQPHELEKRPVPKLEELEAAWVQVHADRQKAADEAATKAKIAEYELATLRCIREFIVKLPDAPQALKDKDALIASERAKLN